MVKTLPGLQLRSILETNSRECNHDHVSKHDTIPQHYESSAYVLLYKNSEGDIKEPSSESKTPENDNDLVDVNLLSEDFDTISISDTSMSEYNVRYSSQDLDTTTDTETDIDMTKWYQLPLI